MNAVNQNARLSADLDDRMRKVKSAANRYSENAQRYLAKRGIDASQQGLDWSPQQRIGIPQSGYMGNSNG